MKHFDISINHYHDHAGQVWNKFKNVYKNYKIFYTIKYIYFIQ